MTPQQWQCPHPDRLTWHNREVHEWGCDQCGYTFKPIEPLTGDPKIDGEYAQ